MSLHKLNRRTLVGSSVGLTAALAAGAASSILAQEAEGEPVYGGTLRSAYPVTDLVGPALDPRLGNGHNENETQSLIFNTLVSVNDSLGPVPELATDWTISDDGLSYRFQLREGVTFHDGTPLTANDVKYTYDFIRDPENASAYVDNFELVSEIVVHGDLDVEFVLSAPNPDLLLVGLGASTGVVPQAYAESVGPEEFNRAPIGTGPFRFVEWISGERVVFERNDNYWQPDLPYLDGVEMRFIPEDAVRLISLETGEIDHFYRFVPPEEVPRIKEDSNLTYMVGIDPGIVYVMLNTHETALSDKRVRQAIGYAVDRAALGVAFGGGEPGVTTVLPNSPAFDASLSDYRYDPDEAKRLYEEAGSPDLSGITLLGLDDYPTYRAMTILVEDFLKQVGMNVTLDLQPRPVLAPRRTEGDFGIVVGGSDNLFTPDASLYNLFHTEGRDNFAKYSNPEIDELLETARMTVDDASRIEIYKQIQSIVLDEAPLHSVLYRSKDAVMSSRVHGYVLRPVRTYSSFAETWIEEA